jgi:hypothetical protein
MAEWHITPDYIIENWTDELLALMVDKLSERKEREVDAIKGRRTSGVSVQSSTQWVSDKELFAQAGNLIKVVRKDGD